ncbi:MAG: hypothetical protein LQ340_000915 [Diploschistes diacapsis]|nr:MAG: hypothetical protein LQ340_000915 [Diploschistes diacapsis]
MGGSTSPEPPKSIFRKIFKKSRSDNDVSANTRRTEHPPPYRHETISPPLISPRQQELSREGRAPGSPPSPLVTTPSLRLLPPSSNKDHARSRSKDRRQEPQGLKAVYEPPEERTADIVFVHGLGGSSITTWSKDQDGTAFWPEAFLSREPVLSTARIFTFGYTAFYWDTNAAGSLSITDFARSLLANLKNAHEMSFGEVMGSAPM